MKPWTKLPGLPHDGLLYKVPPRGVLVVRMIVRTTWRRTIELWRRGEMLHAHLAARSASNGTYGFRIKRCDECGRLPGTDANRCQTPVRRKP